MPPTAGAAGSSLSAMPSATSSAFPPQYSQNEDNTDYGGDESDIDENEYYDDHHMYPPPPPPPPPPFPPSSATQGLSTVPASSQSVLSTTTSSIAATSSTPTTLLTSTSPTATLGAAKGTASVVPSGSLPLNNPDSIPQKKAHPDHEAKAEASALGTAGIVLAAIFGFVALMMVFYLLLRMFRRRKGRRSGRSRSTNIGRSNTLNSQTEFEKGTQAAWTPTAQETGIVFGRRSRSSNYNNQDQPRGRGRFSFLNRRWYSTGSQVASSQIARTEAGASTPPRWGAPLFGLGLRTSPAPQSVWFQSSPSVASTEQSGTHRDTIDELTSDIQRSLSHRSTGEGHARAYAHHNVRAPARSSISSISSRSLKRRSDTVRSEAASSEFSDLYRSTPRPLSSRNSVSRQEKVRSRDSSQIPRLPLPIALQNGGTRFSIEDALYK